MALYLREDLAATAEPIINFSNSVVEVLGLHIKAEDLVLIVIYRQPDDPAGGHRSTSCEFRQALRKIESALESLPSPSPDVIMCGDFNLPHVLWPEGVVKPGATKEERIMTQELISVVNEHYLFQQIMYPTHRCGNILDLCFSNNPGLLHSHQCTSTIFSDHHIVECYTAYTKTTSQSSNRQPQTSDGPGSVFDTLNFMSDDVDWDSLERELHSFDWDSAFSLMNPNQMLHSFLETCCSISQKHVPLRKQSDRKVSKIPRARRILMRRRCKVNKQLANAPSDHKRPKLIAETKDIERKLQKSYKQERSEREHKAVSAIKKNSKYFFSYARKHSKVMSSIGPLLDTIGNLVNCPIRMSEMLAEQYSSVFSSPQDCQLNPEELFSVASPDAVEGTRQPLQDLQFSPSDIARAIGEVSATAAAGPDRFPAMLLRQCQSAISIPLFLIWRKSLDTGEIPQVLKTANIIPIHKGGSRGVPKNYRPIALTSHLIKIFEKVLRNSMVTYMETHGLFNPSQHGFRLGRSCLSQLIAHYDTILEHLASGDNVDVIYIDFAKAFDKVDFNVTLRKISELRITGKIGYWIHSFLVNRFQTVLVKNARSQKLKVKSGVPQGSVLGPLLFLILISDIDQEVASSFLSSFADDTRIGRQIHTAEDASSLQTDLNSVYRWTDLNNMELNADKFECLRYGPNKDLQGNTSYLSNTGKSIQEKDHVKDLGVTMGRDGTFSIHIMNAVTEAERQCSWVLRTFATRQKLPMLTLWKSLVQSKLEYCSQLWCPLAKGDIQTIEMTQRSFLRKISGMNQLSYWEQLHSLNLFSLERRRERYRIIYIWRILEEHVPNVLSTNDQTPKITAKWHPRRGRECMVPAVKQTAPAPIRRLQYASLPIHGQQLFNTLPAEIRNLTNIDVDSFKRRLDKYLQLIPDEPQIPGYTAQRRAESNSLLDMTRLATAHQKSLKVEVPGEPLPPGNEGCAHSIAVVQ